MGVGFLTSKGVCVTWPLRRPHEAVAVAALARRVRLPLPSLSVLRSAIATSRGHALAHMSEATLATVHNRVRVAVKGNGESQNTRKRTVIGKGATGTLTKRRKGTRMRNVAS